MNNEKKVDQLRELLQSSINSFLEAGGELTFQRWNHEYYHEGQKIYCRCALNTLASDPCKEAYSSPQEISNLLESEYGLSFSIEEIGDFLDGYDYKREYSEMSTLGYDLREKYFQTE